ncbi:MAG: Glycosyltransferase [Candidatus Magasanikbacteria bacterium GW2011_GWA2_56_11]|uniref:Glycosyltransferase n=1 Tax=Candidatus Magasanikbacteria bacterium GW2011_GWA2_56_11 TaxID=1619044 RepID=A0A0G1YE58_9BACT|nr:MAG: Glycosyltransferase [Candidatus Magasanikbacteria bacterium GW2011_GWA2_56_11]
MKVCIVNNIYPPFARGGAEQVVVRTVDGLLESGHEVVLITSTPEPDAIERRGSLAVYRLRPPNLFFYTEAHRYTWLSRLVWHALDIFNLAVAWRVRAIVRVERPDVVHTHNLMGLSFLIPAVIRRLGIRHVHTVHDVQLVEPSAIILKQEEHSRRYTGLPIRLYSALMRALIGSPTVVISPSQFLLDFYRARRFFLVSHCVVLRNPVTFDLDSAPLGQAADGTFRFVYVGQIERHKGVHILCQAFKELRKDRADTELHIVGDGSYLEAVRSRADGIAGIEFHGRVDKERLPEIFRRMDMAVVPSLCYENSPTVIFESFAFGVPVLASNIEGIAELIVEGENGLTFAAGEAGALAAKMRWCAEHRGEVRAMSAKTKESLAGLSQREYIERLTELYRG